MEFDAFKNLEDGEAVKVSEIGSYSGLVKGTIVTRSKSWLDDDDSLAFISEDDLFFFDENDVEVI